MPAEVTAVAPRRGGTGTVRFRITALATVALVLVLAVTGVALVLLQRRDLIDGVDEGLRQQADAIAAQVRTDGLRVPLDPKGDDELVAQLELGTTVIAGTDARGLPRLGPPASSSRVSVRTVDRIVGREGAQRVASRRVTTPDGRVGTLHLVTPLDDVAESIRALVRSLLVAIPLVAAILAALVWWLVGRTLRPVEAIRSEVAAVGAGGLHRRVPTPPGDDEIARLAHTMNDMLDRIETASERQQRFVADASHELRTPLTRMRSELEVDLAHPETADPAGAARSILDEVVGLQALVDDLLLLARREAGGARVTAVSVELAAIVRAEAGRAETGRAETGGGAAPTIATDGVAPAVVRGDPEELRRVVRNLLDNATRHARSTVTLGLGTVDGTVVLAVADDGPGIPKDRRQQVFERFTRLDGARSPAAGGAGLGLAIVREIVQRHRGAVVVEDSPGGGARLVVSLPTGPSTAADTR